MKLVNNHPMRQVIPALGFGAAAFLVMVGDIYVYIPGTQIVTDPRELFVTLGAALTGPVGAVLIGLLAGVYHPVPHFSPVVTAAHIGGALWMSMGYRWLLKKRPGTRGMLLGWAGMVLMYYFGVLVPLLTALTFLTPALDGVIFMGNPTLWHALGDLARGAVPEALATTLLTAIMLALLPARVKHFQRHTGG